jgi:catechol 2,3-dioxygenase-like lactoylglutathione lyase family enzyme
MALHGLSDMTLGVADVHAVGGFYEQFGLRHTGGGVFASHEGGEQLRIVAHPYRRLLAVTVAADDADDVDRVRSAAAAHDVELTEHPDGSVSVVEPNVGLRITVAARPRVEQARLVTPDTNAPAPVARPGERAPAIFRSGPVSPRRLGHVLYGTPDIEASTRFLIDVVGFKLSDASPGIIAFLRCSADHHNIGLMSSPVPFFHHSSWQVNDVDEIGQGAQHMMTNFEGCSAWGLGRHFLGSNFFWYLRDPAGNFAEYYADLDQIVDDDAWVARNWEPDKSLYAWGPAVPIEFISPPDLEEIAAAMAATSVPR